MSILVQQTWFVFINVCVKMDTFVFLHYLIRNKFNFRHMMWCTIVWIILHFFFIHLADYKTYSDQKQVISLSMPKLQIHSITKYTVEQNYFNEVFLSKFKSVPHPILILPVAVTLQKFNNKVIYYRILNGVLCLDLRLARPGNIYLLLWNQEVW